MSWLTIERFHPVENWVTFIVDNALLALLGFPDWALIANNAFRHYYGYLIHADVPWTFGRGAMLMVSPVMHQWHHAKDVEGAGSNFVTVFSVFDRAFGTYYVPGRCNVPLGVTEDLGSGAMDHIVSPFRAWAKRFGQRSLRAATEACPSDEN